MREKVEELQAHMDQVATLEHNLESAKRSQVLTLPTPAPNHIDTSLWRVA
jgi:hypothetical protein